MAKVTVNGITYTAESGTKLEDVFAQVHSTSTPALAMPCGGHGRCGKCRIRAGGSLSGITAAESRFLSPEEISQGIRLACCATVEGDCNIDLPEDPDQGQIRVSGYMPAISLQPAFSSYGFALDIGTTTLAARLYDAAGNLLGEGSLLNPQARWGADVISRIEADLKGEGPALSASICRAVDELVVRLSHQAKIEAQEIDGLVITGNTVMLHLLTGTSTEPLSHAPFAAERLFGEMVSAETTGLASVSGTAQIYLAPCVSAFVGADLITALLAGGICETAETKLLADIGTNGEMALWYKGQLFCCSTAAGPAFEGAGISMGMGGSRGAIDRVAVKDGKLTVHVIGDTAPLGICGSGVVDTAACLLETGRMDETGYIGEESAVICDPVIFTQNDVRMVQLAKSAIHAGIRTLLHKAGIECTEVSSLLIAGGFGSYLDVEKAARIGLFPMELLSCIRVVGNGALGGASMLLLNKDYRSVCEEYVRQARGVELSADPYFADEYMERMLF